MKFLHNHKAKFTIMPKRLANMIGVPAVQSQNMAGYVKSFAAPIPGGWVGLAAADGATGKGALASGGATANQYLILKGATTSPFITADLYDSNLRTVTALTISGALAETLADAASDLAQASLIYLPTRAAWYVKSGSVSKVYPLTLSGTTLTIGTAIDISATFATTGNLLMTGDTTNTLYFFDNVAGLMKKCSVTAISTIGAFSALTAPSAGYSATTLIAGQMGWAHSNGKIYFIAPAKTGGTVATFQEYDVAGNSWTSKTWPNWLRPYLAQQVALIVDPANNTNIWFLSAPQAVADTYQLEAIVTRWTTATNTPELYAYTNGQVFAQSQIASGFPPSANNTGFVYVNFNHRSGFASVANGDIGFVNMAGASQLTPMNIYNLGTQWGRITVANYSGSGYLLGLTAAYANNVSLSVQQNPPLYNAPLTAIITIDGGTERFIHLQGTTPADTMRMLKLAFATSLKVEFVGGGKIGIVSGVPVYAPVATVLVNILS